MHDRNSFLTLTYNDENMPKSWSLQIRDFQTFMKRVRKHFEEPIRFYHCGEYDEGGRPHYHALIFGQDWSADRTLMRRGKKPLWRSETLEKQWPHGFSSVGRLNYQTAAYTTRYLLKKVTGDQAENHYERVGVEHDGEITQLAPEYTTMSRRPGIGAAWIEKYRDDVYPRDEIIISDKERKPPRYYDDYMKTIDPAVMKKIKTRRIREGKKYANEKTWRRLRVREKVTAAKAKEIPRN